MNLLLILLPVNIDIIFALFLITVKLQPYIIITIIIIIIFPNNTRKITLNFLDKNFKVILKYYFIFSFTISTKYDFFQIFFN